MVIIVLGIVFGWVMNLFIKRGNTTTLAACLMAGIAGAYLGDLFLEELTFKRVHILSAILGALAIAYVAGRVSTRR